MAKQLLATWTKDPFQPVRIYYTIPNRELVEKKLRKLKCMVEESGDRGWEWIFHGEAASLRFGVSYDAVPKNRRPIILGRIKFPQNGGMTLQTNAIPRAIAAARFFAPRLGPRVVALRCRLVYRYFSADEGSPAELMKILDQDVSVIDPRQGEASFAAAFDGVDTLEDAECAAATFLDKALASQQDVPPVEDFPLAPEEETPEFTTLAATLGFRFVRAFERWRGNTHVTLADIVVRAVEQSMSEQSLGSGHELFDTGAGR